MGLATQRSAGSGEQRAGVVERPEGDVALSEDAAARDGAPGARVAGEGAVVAEHEDRVRGDGERIHDGPALGERRRARVRLAHGPAVEEEGTVAGIDHVAADPYGAVHEGGAARGVGGG